MNKKILIGIVSTAVVVASTGIFFRYFKKETHVETQMQIGTKTDEGSVEGSMEICHYNNPMGTTIVGIQRKALESVRGCTTAGCYTKWVRYEDRNTGLITISYDCAIDTYAHQGHPEVVEHHSSLDVVYNADDTVAKPVLSMSFGVSCFQ